MPKDRPDGRRDEVLDQLEPPDSNQIDWIDYILVVPPGAGSLCVPVLDPTATRIFADDPDPFAPACGPAPAAICWPSDHEGAALGLDCDSSGVR